jgi:hypothetical protein
MPFQGSHEGKNLKPDLYALSPPVIIGDSSPRPLKKPVFHRNPFSLRQFTVKTTRPDRGALPHLPSKTP